VRARVEGAEKQRRAHESEAQDLTVKRGKFQAQSPW